MFDGSTPQADAAAGRGVLYPSRLPTFARITAPERVAEMVRWFWIPEWQLPPGRTSRQHVIAFAASNLVVEPTSVDFVGPTTRASHRDLTGTGWAVGALLRPAAVPSFTDAPSTLRDGQFSLDAPELVAALRTALHHTPGSLGDARDPDAPTRDSHVADPDAGGRHGRAAEAFSDWLLDRIGEPDAEGRFANELADLVETDSSIVHVTDLARRLGASVRTVQRLCRRHVGLTPAAMIRRRRLQEAAEAVRLDPTTDLARLAASLGYADHAHLTRDFRDVLGFTPSRYRSAHHEATDR